MEGRLRQDRGVALGRRIAGVLTSVDPPICSTGDKLQGGLLREVGGELDLLETLNTLISDFLKFFFLGCPPSSFSQRNGVR